MRFNLRNKLLAAFGVVLALLVVVGWVGLGQAAAIDARVEDMYSQEVLGLENLDDLKSAAYRIRGDLLEYILADTEEGRARLKGEIAEQQKRIEEKIQLYRQTRLSDEEEALLAAFEEPWKRYSDQIEQVFQWVEAGDLEAAETLARKEMVDEFRTAREAVNKLMDYSVERAALRRENARHAYASERTLIIGLIVGAVLIGLAISIFMARSIANAAKRMAQAVQQVAQVDLTNLAAATAAMADGDLTRSVSIQTQNIEIKSSDEIGDLGQAFNLMIERLQETGNAFNKTMANLRRQIGKVQENASLVASASQQITAASEQSAEAVQQVAMTIQQVADGVSQQAQSAADITSQVDQMSSAVGGVAEGAQDQARSVESISRSIAEMTTVADRVAESAQSIAADAGRVTDTAEASAQTVMQTVEAIQLIRETVAEVSDKVQQMQEYSTQIGVIVETIDDIAEQTNLLALNAAIEAARAGEQGRGFAVVADEVRKLAERSGQATKEIAQLIQSVQQGTGAVTEAMRRTLEQVESGVDLAGMAGRALEDILEAIRGVTGEIQEVAAKSQELTGINQELMSAAESVSAVVEENTAATEELAASADEIGRAIESIASVSEENSAAAEEVSASAEEMSAQVEEMAATAQSLADMAKQLQAVVAEFTLSTEGTAPQDASTPVFTREPVAPERDGTHKPATVSTELQREPLYVSTGNGRH